jgi:tRNA1Val (adenine37-N6)-methyltransferase
MESNIFRFKQFSIGQELCSMKVNTDGVLLGAWSNVADKKSILDVGTGTGIIAMMLAQRNETAIVTALDIDEYAVQQARSNFEKSVFSNRMTIRHISVQEYAQNADVVYDLICSNPPFFTGGICSNNQNKASVRHTIKLSHDDLLRSVCLLLAHKGTFDLILPYSEGLRFIRLANINGFHLKRITYVRTRHHKHIARLLISLTNVPILTKEDHLVIHDLTEPEKYSEDYIRLTSEFYLFM